VGSERLAFTRMSEAPPWFRLAAHSIRCVPLLDLVMVGTQPLIEGMLGRPMYKGRF
jgi:hypothetical protein